MPLAKPTPTPDELRTALAALDAVELGALAVLAHGGMSTSRSGWTRECSQRGVRRTPSRALSGAEFQRLADKLVDAGLVRRIDDRSHTHYHVLAEVAMAVLVRVSELGRWSALFPRNRQGRRYFGGPATPDVRTAAITGNATMMREALRPEYDRTSGSWA